ncbi:MAG: manganese efflux pump [Bacilli bacterium]|nr:manganese efflux pump [Bacilli bacterium]
MLEIITLFSVGLALSMDTFSLSLGLGTFNISNRKALLLALIVGIMHFLMPYLGMLLGNTLISIFKINNNFLLGLILIAISLEMLFDLLKKENRAFNLSLIGMFFFALGVSLDSFSTGIGLNAITHNIYMAMGIFSICSFCFTYIGLILGKYCNHILGVYSSVLGSLLLLTIGILHLFK